MTVHKLNFSINHTTIILGAFLILTQMGLSQNNIKFTHIRHATSIIEINNKKILIDPMLSDKDSLASVGTSDNTLRNPRTNLPFSIEHIVENLNYLLLTHLHFDHFDQKAINEIPKQTNILCSLSDSKKIKELGFTSIYPINNDVEIDGLKIKIYPAIHGVGILKLMMGKGSSFLIDHKGFKIFITGDCILNNALKTNLLEANPDVVIANGGAAKLKFGKPITMSANDIQEISSMLKDAKIILCHLDALNHCPESKEFCKETLKNSTNIIIPNDGETIKLQ